MRKLIALTLGAAWVAAWYAAGTEMASAARVVAPGPFTGIGSNPILSGPGQASHYATGYAVGPFQIHANQDPDNPRLGAGPVLGQVYICSEVHGSGVSRSPDCLLPRITPPIDQETPPEATPPAIQIPAIPLPASILFLLSAIGGLAWLRGRA